MRVVAALGGNALLRRGEVADPATQRANAHVAAQALAPVAAEHELVVTHGNGPQVGLLALQAAAIDGQPVTPLDVLGAESDGMIGYVLAQELGNALPGREVATLLTQVLVDPSDPAFLMPTKPIGPVYPDEATARRAARGAGWALARDGAGWRRVVPSPEPAGIVELGPIARLARDGVVVVCAGGGGVPVRRRPGGGLEGVEAVVDKDLTAALLATALGADALLLLTDVDAVYRAWGTDAAAPLRAADPAELRAAGLDRGSMGPKAEAAARFVEAGGGLAAIGRLQDAGALLDGAAGTHVLPPVAAARP
ncbi:MAG: carbamate kinase [Solirubrobacteraceae bacterium]